MFGRYLEDGTKLITMQKLPDIDWMADRTELHGTLFGKSWNASEAGYGVFVYTVNRCWACAHCTVVQERGLTRECEICSLPRKSCRDSTPNVNLRDSYMTD